ncbi:4-hydroxyproline epimerase [Pseudoduganella armeniaca]|uniref:4-hydroxyproline epimerase n=1 Tax=Pseudoduganella armeniaca TaxID=2072590 RepID=A0A2R4C7Q3_9BURK|nr:4-hydroxyproline epimerase [Pseudoduganella armeniaca]AVR95653.1 4-hydroxyproline epimerase [Pseudoduganella armeniaca]
MTKTLTIIDSHTGGEPTRLIVDGGPDLGTGPLAERLARLRDEHDLLRTGTVCEPRGSDVLVGALLCAPHADDCVAGVIFFNNVGYLGMCGHGTIGLVKSLAHLGRIGPGRHRIDTPVGVVVAELHADGAVSVDNVPAWRLAKERAVLVPGFGTVVGDIAWGGNWFFLVEQHGLAVAADNIDALSAFAQAVMQALDDQGIRGAGGAPIDHVELFGPSQQADSRNFVLCPGKAYDRSPCGTGTSAKLACLAADGKLAEGEVWRQESIIGSLFEASYRREGERIAPTIRGRAWISGESWLVFEEDDPFAWGIPASA